MTSQDKLHADAIALRQLLESTHGAEDEIQTLELRSPLSLWMLQSFDLPAAVNDKAQLYPYTRADLWAKTLMVSFPGIHSQAYPPLARRPIPADSHDKVHVLICGFDQQAEALALHAALIAHYPNYRSTDERPIRSRITIIDRDLSDRRDSFIARYKPLFDNSLYRIIDVEKGKEEVHRPQYEGRRLDFVDVEWEFVTANTHNPLVMERLERWATDPNRQLTVYISHGDDERNLAEATSLPAEVYTRQIPVLPRLSYSQVAEPLSRSAKYMNVRPFGMEDTKLDVWKSLIQLAKMLNYFYQCSFSDKGIPTSLPQKQVEEAWQRERSFKNRFSCVYNVMTIASKLQAIGHDTTSPDTFYALTKEEISTLARVEHNRWSVERLISGSRPCTDSEREEILADITRKRWYKKNRDVHFDLCAFEELRPDETGKNSQVYDYDLTTCIPLMVQAFNDLNRGK